MLRAQARYDLVEDVLRLDIFLLMKIGVCSNEMDSRISLQDTWWF